MVYHFTTINCSKSSHGFPMEISPPSGSSSSATQPASSCHPAMGCPTEVPQITEEPPKRESETLKTTHDDPLRQLCSTRYIIHRYSSYLGHPGPMKHWDLGAQRSSAYQRPRWNRPAPTTPSSDSPPRPMRIWSESSASFELWNGLLTVMFVVLVITIV